MFKYEYLCPATLQEACDMLSKYGSRARIIAGGTDLMVQIREQDKRWKGIEYVVDLTHIKGLDNISETDGFIRIGAMATHDQIFKAPLLKDAVPFLSEASNSVGSLQIRNRGTIGGSICNASPAADPVPVLVALDAEVALTSVRGIRVLTLKSIYKKANETNIEPDEILTEVRFTRLDKEAGCAFIKLGRRKAMAISRLNVAVSISLNKEGKANDVRISPGCVFAIPDRVCTAEEVLLGKVPTDTLITEAGKMVSEEMISRTGVRWSTEYKRPVIEALTRRALKQALGVK